MPDFVAQITARTSSELATSFNSTLSPLLSNEIKFLSLDATDQLRNQGFEYRILLSYNDSGSVITNPYKFRVFINVTASEVQQDIQDFINANGSFWFGPSFIRAFAQTRLEKNVVGFLVYNENATDGPANWQFGGGSPPTGVAGGDLTGAYPNPTVVAIQGQSVPSPAASSGQVLTWDGTNLVYNQPQLAFASLAAAVAAQPQVVGSRIIISPGATASEAGTYQVDANTGSSGDYTKISDHTDTASEVTIVDAGNYYVSTNVEDALQEVGAGSSGNQTTAGVSSATVVASVSDSNNSVVWMITAVDGTERYTEQLMVTHDGSTAYTESQGTAIVPAAAGKITTSVALSGGDIELTFTPSSGTWDVTVKAVALQ